MSRLKYLIALGALLLSSQALALFELDLDFSYNKQVYGTTRQNDLVSRTYATSLAVYLFQNTAIEFSYAHTDDITTEANVIKVEGTNSSIVGMQNRVRTRVAGIGIRQALAGRKSRFRPMISLGYARLLIDDRTDFSFRDDGTNQVLNIEGELSKRRQDSAFGTFSVQIRMTKTFSLKASVKTIIPAFDFDRASDNMKYAAGIVWFF
ncbi:MAG: hypothetical protein HN509_12370 [Halobacteriovoraceae bacterium]|jgi:hypothetical protein|nr:hypothetical protein [Halobacteriovoraceae bacterium]MBT5093000.1 hypothetical protein [Halobacteriovoraceae bacterium]